MYLKFCYKVRSVSVFLPLLIFLIKQHIFTTYFIQESCFSLSEKVYVPSWAPDIQLFSIGISWWFYCQSLFQVLLHFMVNSRVNVFLGNSNKLEHCCIRHVCILTFISLKRVGGAGSLGNMRNRSGKIMTLQFSQEKYNWNQNKEYIQVTQMRHLLLPCAHMFSPSAVWFFATLGLQPASFLSLWDFYFRLCSGLPSHVWYRTKENCCLI